MFIKTGKSYKITVIFNSTFTLNSYFLILNF